MYTRNIPKLPAPITREEFVSLVFDLGYRHMHGCDTTITAVQLGDYFVSYSGERQPHRELSPQERDKVLSLLQRNPNASEQDITDEVLAVRETRTIMDELVPQVYSVELAHIITVIVAKFNEDIDNGYCHTSKAIRDTDNCYVRKMEWEIFTLMGFQVKVYNFITIIGAMLVKDDIAPRLGSEFTAIAKDVCMNKDLLHMNPWTVVMGVILLGKKGKLKSIQAHREEQCLHTLSALADEYELDLNSVLKAYIEHKRK